MYHKFFDLVSNIIKHVNHLIQMQNVCTFLNISNLLKNVC